MTSEIRKSKRGKPHHISSQKISTQSLAEQLKKRKQNLTLVKRPVETPSLVKEVSVEQSDPSKLRATPIEPITVGTPEAAAAFQRGARVKLLTFNTWICQDDIGPRMNSLADLISSAGADISFLQELTPQSLEHLIRSLSAGPSLWITPLAGQLSVYKSAVLSRVRPGRAFVFDMLASGRKATAFIWDLAGGDRLGVASVHLQSEGDRAAQRAAQFFHVAQMLREQQGVTQAIVAGDFNMCSPTEDSAIFGVKETGGFVDAHVVCNGRKSDGFTFDRACNPFAEAGRLRLDRVALWQVQAKSCGIVGNKPIPGVVSSKTKGPLFISDHFGLLVEVIL